MLRATHNWWSGTESHSHHARKVHGNARRVWHRRIADFTLEHDPSGDYRRGACFSATELRYMLEDGTIDDGAVLVGRGGRWSVEGGRLIRSIHAEGEQEQLLGQHQQGRRLHCVDGSH